jgi:HK97 family phage major capsid protein
MQLVDAIIKAVDNMLFIRAKATKYRVDSALSLGVPTIESDPSDGEWTAEANTATSDTAMNLCRRELKPHQLSKLVKVSNKLIRLNQNTEAIVTDRVAYKIGVSQEKGFMTGNGVNQPLGLFVASNDGIPTSRDVSTGNTATAITFDGLKEAKYSVKAQYMRVAEWIFHRDAIKMLSKIKDGEGDYIWEPSTTMGDPDMLLGSAFNMSEYAPNTFTTGQYVGLYGDMSFYWIADSMDMQIQRLVELYAGSNQIGLIARTETDGMPVLAEAFARVKLGS